MSDVCKCGLPAVIDGECVLCSTDTRRLKDLLRRRAEMNQEWDKLEQEILDRKQFRAENHDFDFCIICGLDCKKEAKKCLECKGIKEMKRSIDRKVRDKNRMIIELERAVDIINEQIEAEYKEFDQLEDLRSDLRKIRFDFIAKNVIGKG